MKKYKLSAPVGPVPSFVQTDDGMSIPLVGDNMDCHQFLIDWRAGAEVKNPDDSPAPYSDAAVQALGLEPVAP